MKQLIFLYFLSFTIIPGIAQNKWNYSTFTNLMELQGTEYVIVSANYNSKLAVKSRELSFINTSTGDSKEIRFEKGTYITNVEHIKIDSLGINKVLISGCLIPEESQKMNNWYSQNSIILCSVEGSELNRRK